MKPAARKGAAKKKKEVKKEVMKEEKMADYDSDEDEMEIKAYMMEKNDLFDWLIIVNLFILCINIINNISLFDYNPRYKFKFFTFRLKLNNQVMNILSLSYFFCFLQWKYCLDIKFTWITCWEESWKIMIIFQY